MSTLLLDELVRQAEQLTLEEQLALVARIAERASKGMIGQRRPESKRRYKWLDASGLVKEPLFLEDAQTWVTRTRREGDERRERQWVQQR